jgi:hypothetical protein
MRHSTATLALGTCVLWLLVSASAARLDEQHVLSDENIEDGAGRNSNDCDLDYYCRHNSRPTCDLRRGASPCTGTNKQIAFFPGTFTQDQCDAACREASTKCRSFAVAANGGAYGCYLYNQEVSICGGLPGAGNWAYSDRNCPHSWTRPVCDLKGGASYCTNSPRQITVIPGTFTPAQCGKECKATLNCRSFALASAGGPYGCYLYNYSVSVCHGEPGASNWAYYDKNCEAYDSL